jgi:hypothetical protein
MTRQRAAVRVRCFLRSHSISRAPSGWILVEILVALVLLAIVLGPLVDGLATAMDRAAAIRGHAEGDSSGRLDSGKEASSGALDAWNWGPRVTSAVWHPGPSLEILTREDVERPQIVGAWLDGWFRGEESPDQAGIVTLRASSLAGCCGRELVVRVRQEGGEWGPPWRSLVPDSYARLPSTTATADGVLAANGGETEAYTVVHAPERANPGVRTSDGTVRMLLDALAFPVFLPPVTVGAHHAEVGKDQQSWLMEAGRALDLYF